MLLELTLLDILLLAMCTTLVILNFPRTEVGGGKGSNNKNQEAKGLLEIYVIIIYNTIKNVGAC